MGSCCNTNSNLIAEQFVRDVLSDESLKIRNYNYMELLNEIVSKRVEQEIPKEHIKQFLIPEFYDSNKTESNDIYIDSIFKYILDQLEDKNNMYIVLLYFYPFILSILFLERIHSAKTYQAITSKRLINISITNH